MRYKIKQSTLSKIQEMPFELRPREKMKNNGTSSLSDEELTTILLGSGNKTKNVSQLADEVVKMIDQSEEIKYANLIKIKGLGPAKVSLICAALELGRRKIYMKKRQILEPEDAYKVVRHFATRMQEQFIVIALNSAYEVLSVDVASMGTVNQCMVHPREVFATPIKKRSIAVILAHNHPTGNLHPSSNDLLITNRLKQCGEILGIKILDHIIFSEDNFYSLEENEEL